MKKRKSLLFGIVLTVAITLSACAKEVEEVEVTEVVESVSEITEDVEEMEDIVEEEVESESAVEETEEAVEYVTADVDLSFLGEAIKDLYIISNDESKLKTRQEVIDYFHEKGYLFYPYLEAEETKTYEEVVSKNNTIVLKPDYILEHANDDKYSGVHISTGDSTGVGERLECVQYIMSKCSAETVAAAREYFNNALASGVFEDCGCEVEISHDGDEATWTWMTIRVKGEPINPAQRCDYFFELQISLGEYKTNIFLDIY